MALTEADIEICNLALDDIGGDAISGGNEQTDVAATCSRQFPRVRDNLLSLYGWGFVNLHRQLARLADVTPLIGWKYAYQLPSDMLGGPEAVYGDGSDRSTTAFTIARDQLHTDYEIVAMLYRASGTDPATWPAYFRNLAVTALGSKLAVPVMGDRKLAESLHEQAFGTRQEQGRGGLFAAARTEDARTRPIRSMMQNGDPLTSTRH